MSLKALREKRAKLVADMRGILDAASQDDDRELTEEEAANYDDLKGQVAKLDSQIEREQEVSGMEAALETPDPAVAQRSGPGGNIPRAGGPEASREFESLGEFLATVVRNPNDQRLANLYDEEAGAVGQDGLRAEQRMDTGASGGFMVPTQFRSDLMRVDPQASIIRPRATVIPPGDPPDSAVTIPALDQTGTVPANVYGGVTVDWIAEGASKPETDAALREIKLEPQEVAGHVILTDKLLRNWQASGSLIENLLRQAIRAAEDDQFLNGNGVGKPLGLITSAAAHTVTRDTNSDVKYADVSEMISRILARGGTPIWIASRAVQPKLLNMRNEIGSPPVGDGSLIWQPNARDTAGNQLLMGYPILWNERSPGLGSKGDLVLTDLSYYLIKDGSGPFVAASEHVKFLENKTVIKIFWNVDGQPWLTEPFKGEDNYSTSPFVALSANA